MINKIKINEFCTVVRGSSPRPKGDPRYYGGPVPRLMVSDLTRDGMYVIPKLDSLTLEGAEKSRPMKKGDFIVAVSGDPGRPCILGIDACIHDGFAGFRDLNTSIVHTPFLYHFFKYFKEKNKSLAVGAIFKNLNTQQLKDLEIPLPPLKTQKRIASILEEATALLDKTAQLITEYDLLARSIFSEMFGDPVINTEGWKTEKLIEVSNQITDGTHHSPKTVKKGFPYVTAKHIKEMSLEFHAKPTYVNKEAHDEIYSRCQPEYRDVFLIKDGATTGIACLNSFTEPISLLSSVGLIKPNKELLNSTYLVFWFNHIGVKKQLIRKYMSGAAIKRYTISKMKKFNIMVPPIKLQNQFADKIALIEQQKTLAKQELQESEDLFNCLLQKAFKGELV